MSTTHGIDFNDLAIFISDETYRAMAAAYRNPTFCGWNKHDSANDEFIGSLLYLREKTGVTFISNERRGDLWELTTFAGRYIIWRQRRVTT